MVDGTAAYSVPRGSETILVVEHDEALRLLLRMALERCGYTILEAASGPAALQLVELHGAKISLLISDVDMPRPQLAHRLAASLPGLRVLLLAARDCAAGVVESGVAFLRKPFRPSALVAKVRLVLDAVADGLEARPRPAAATLAFPGARSRRGSDQGRSADGAGRTA